MKYFVFVTFLGIAACGNGQKQYTEADHQGLETSVQISKDSLIIPGKQVGKTIIGASQDSALRPLGTADATDAAMGKVLVSYFRPDSLDLFFGYKDSSMKEKDLKQVIIRSGNYQTKDGLSIGSSLYEIQQKYPNGEVQTSDGEQYFEVPEKGISFQVPGDTCKAIIIFNQKQKPNYSAHYH